MKREREKGRRGGQKRREGMKEKEEEREMWRMGKMKFHHRPHPPTFHNPHPHLPHKHLTDEIPSAHQSTSFPCLCLWMICGARYCGVPQCAHLCEEER